MDQGEEVAIHMTGYEASTPMLFCFDGSDGSHSAMLAASRLINPSVDVVVLTVWEAIATRLALSGAFVANIGTGSDLNAQEETFATTVAEDGARRAKEHGFKASPLVRESMKGVAATILEVADELSARLIVCGQRGRGAVRNTLLGSVSHALISHAHTHAILIAPELRSGLDPAIRSES